MNTKMLWRFEFCMCFPVYFVHVLSWLNPDSPQLPPGSLVYLISPVSPAGSLSFVFVVPVWVTFLCRPEFVLVSPFACASWFIVIFYMIIKLIFLSNAGLDRVHPQHLQPSSWQMLAYESTCACATYVMKLGRFINVVDSVWCMHKLIRWWENLICVHPL